MKNVLIAAMALTLGLASSLAMAGNVRCYIPFLEKGTEVIVQGSPSYRNQSENLISVCSNTSPTSWRCNQNNKIGNDKYPATFKQAWDGPLVVIGFRVSSAFWYDDREELYRTMDCWNTSDR